MPDDAHDAMLDRNLFKVQIAESFAPQIELLEQLVNYGTNLTIRCFNSSKRGIPDTVAILGFLKHAVTSLDAVHVLSKEGAALACFPHIRSIFEIDLYLRWIFAKDYENRATAYFVWNTRRKRYWLRCYLQGTPEYDANDSHMQGAPGGPPSVPLSQQEIQSAIDIENNKLNCPETSHVNSLFDNHVKKSGMDVEWYRPFGVNSIRDMAISLRDEATYKVFYSHYSDVTHGLSLDQQMHFNAADGEVVFDHIRTLDNIDQVFQMASSYTIRVFRHSLDFYRSGEIEAFNRKYLTEWREPFESIPKVFKKGSTFTIETKKQSSKSGPRE
jgi:hypothetical protein